MDEDERVLVFGEDVAESGGVFRAPDGLLEAFGPDRVWDTPISEISIVGSAIGLALYGFRPVAEIQFSGFMAPAFD
ncbi:MAG: alpha-ketoacid dehydrogenase subunit beta, partial [Halobacteriales archaeon]|nr:alpha-ketoacid dehydrogenase subunit beta [Halobacteriales archaeon]